MRAIGVVSGKRASVSSTIETLERELGEAQPEREKQQRAVIRAENAHEAACVLATTPGRSPRASATDDEVERLPALVYQRRRELYEAIDRLKAAEGKERRIKSRLMYVLPAERSRYLSGAVDEEFEELLPAVRRHTTTECSPGVEVSVVTERPGELDLRGDATWRALERLYSGTVRRWVEIRAGGAPGRGGAGDGRPDRLLRGRARPTGLRRGRGGATDGLPSGSRPAGRAGVRWRGSTGPEGRLALARITARRYLDEGSVGRLGKRPQALVQVAEIARLYQTMNLTGDEIRWRLEQLISLRLEVLETVYRPDRRTTPLLLLRDSPRGPPPRQPLPRLRRRRRSSGARRSNAPSKQASPS